MAVADMMHVVAMKIHVAPAGHILDENALSPTDAAQARRRHGLMQERLCVAIEQRARLGIDMALAPRFPRRCRVGVAFGLGWGTLAHDVLTDGARPAVSTANANRKPSEPETRRRQSSSQRCILEHRPEPLYGRSKQ